MSINESYKSLASSSLDLSYLREIGNNNELFIEKMLTHFTTDIPYFLASLNDAIETNDAVNVKIKAHKAKSVAGYLNDQSLHLLMQDLEADGANNTLNENTKRNFEKAKSRFTLILKEINTYLGNQ